MNAVQEDVVLLDAMLEAGLLPAEKAGELRRRLALDWRPAAAVVIEQSGVEEGALLAFVAAHLGIGHVDSLAGVETPAEFLERVPPEYARQAGVVARALTADSLDIAVAPGVDMASVITELSCLFRRQVTCVLAPRREIERVMDRSVRQRPEYLTHAAGELGGDDLAESAAQVERVTDFGELMRKTPVVKLVSLLVAQAVRTGASDIHFQPIRESLRVRFRNDGILHDIIDLPRSSQDAILSRVKVLGKMDIAERRAPQDGRASFRYADREIDVRISVVPTTEGERAVLRLFDKQAKLLGLEELGLDQANLARFDELIHNPSGMILVTGPTGSGKNTTLYAALTKIHSPDQNVITIEDPVEYRLEDISQIQVLPKKNVTFGSVLRSVLRQDPDIMMIGEIRDAETASIVVQSALTGHLVFSTLHTNDSAGAVARLLDLEVEPFLASSALLAVLAQRLVRRVCRECAEPDKVSDAELATLGITSAQAQGARLLRGRGCDACLGTGYLGRIGIFELLVVDDAIREMVNRRASSGEIREAAARSGLSLLRADGAAKALAGVTSVEEVLRVTRRDMT